MDTQTRPAAPPSPPDTPSGAKLRASGVERQFISGKQKVHALGPLDLTVADGEFVCLVGPSGCGKSTFLRVVNGLLPPTAGTLDLWLDEGRAATSMVFQDYGVLPWKTVLANVRFGLDMAKVPRKEANARAMDWIRRLGLAGFEKAYPATLSGGMRQRVSIARALAVQPQILLMDEPFAAVDAQMRVVLQEVLLKVWEEDRRTVIFVTHSLEEALVLGDRVVVVSARPGRVVSDIRVPFERPRPSDLRGTPEFAALHQNVWDVLRDEVQASLAAGKEQS
ncbi:ABC transporter ATP-binding protein [Dactylosporangium sp. NPDC000244]|uniref:ABC transporter ATP-binding protein n=1 Tax=Dactylosporangium sp. NPDC000244 TaxID=3154365 RepID=UPI0033194549|nr:ABC transporter ATP-binding protein [Dactylosporangium thailandense]